MRQNNRLVLTILMLSIFVLPTLGHSEAAKNKKQIILEDFTHLDPSGFPLGWKPQRDDPAPIEIYKVEKQADGNILRANGKPNRIFKKMAWNPNEYPYISWKWRMLKVPNDPDKERNATVYISLGTDILGIPKLTKYAWSSNKAVGTEESGGMFRPLTIVIRSGEPDSDGWVTETINALEEYRRIHDEDPPNDAYGFGIVSTLEAEFGPIIAHQ